LNYQAGKRAGKQANIQAKRNSVGDKISEQSFINKPPVELRNDSA